MHHKYYLKEIRPRVLKRDNFRCTKCGKKTSEEKDLHVHHVDESGIKEGYWNKDGNHNINNLITLCFVCHGQEHSKVKTTYKVEFLIELKNQGMTYREIAKQFNVSHQAIHQRIKSFEKTQSKFIS